MYMSIHYFLNDLCGLQILIVRRLGLQSEPSHPCDGTSQGTGGLQILILSSGGL